jgi:hypothetical protein
MQDIIAVLVQAYILVGVIIGAVVSVAPQRMWNDAFKDANFAPKQGDRFFLALVGLASFIVFWPFVLGYGARGWYRRR